MRVFWAQGYEGASLAELTGAMGITKTSMYAAFGNKEELFRKALERYAAGPAVYVTRALEEPTARAVAFAFLRGAVCATTPAEGPSGCLAVQGALASSEESRAVHDLLVDWRNDAGVHLEARFRRAVDEGDLPSDADPRRLARFIMTMGFGIAVQAANGLGPAELDEIVDTALLDWPV
ncbi:HTH-type transcriptional repressor ComR [Nocardia sp. RB20]|uniref:HTH-type transcriptional repressor ComR n=2 Tax=Nocardia macrotermitis TaxID=2585198 RepID=A0A7K0D372_9NOCA|nr:HTH-type transcriptional repressor ComR [Nocardia macrotermitis]